jgi:hypothetical protein
MQSDRTDTPEKFWPWLVEFIEAICNFCFAMIVFFMAALLAAPLLKYFRALEGFWGGALSLALVGLLYAAVRLGAEPALELLDRIRQGKLFTTILSPLRNISAVLGIYGVFKLQYFLVHGDPAPDGQGASWSELMWRFLTSL